MFDLSRLRSIRPSRLVLPTPADTLRIQRERDDYEDGIIRSVPPHFSYPLIGSISAGGDGNSVNTTPTPISTIGANLFIVVATVLTTQSTTPTDTFANTYTFVTSKNDASGPTMTTNVYQCFNGTTGAAHAWAYGTTVGFPALSVFAFSGATTGAADVSDGKNGSLVTSLQAGATGITPNFPNEILVACLGFYGTASAIAIDSSYLGLTQSNYAASVSFGVAAAYIQQGAVAFSNPTFSWTGTNNCAAVIASFRGTAAPSGTTETQLERGTRGVDRGISRGVC